MTSPPSAATYLAWHNRQADLHGLKNPPEKQFKIITGNDNIVVEFKLDKIKNVNSKH